MPPQVRASRSGNNGYWLLAIGYWLLVFLADFFSTARLLDYQRKKPPSEWMTCPVTQPDSGPASQAMRRAASCGVPSRPMGNRGSNSARKSGEIQPVSVG